MELYILDNNDLSTLSILECSSYEINLDNQFTDKSTFRVNKAPGQIKDNFLVVNGLYQQFLFIINEVEATDKEEKFVNLICSDISNVFNRKIIQKDTNLMTSRSIEYFLAHMIDENFINSDDSFLNKNYVEVTYYESTQAKEATNAENGIYNFHTFMENCREHKNVFTDFKFEDRKLKVTIKHKEDTPVIIDTTLPEVTHYNKVYEQDITAKVQVYIRENDSIQNYYLKTDRTITTDKNDPNRASGAIEVISVETEDDALQEATNVFKGNTYKHLVEFSMSKNSKLVDTTQLYICRAITIKTPDGIYDSIISGISLDDDNFINFKSGNIRINFIDKLKQEQENYGNKLDVTGGVIKGDIQIQGKIGKNLGSEQTIIPNTNILDIQGSTDGFKIDYESPSADTGITTFYTEDDNNAKMSFGNKVSGTYKQAFEVVDGLMNNIRVKNAYAEANGGNTANYIWHRIATVTAGTGSWVDKDTIILIKAGYDNSYWGLIKCSLRTNNASQGAACGGNVRWLARAGFGTSDIAIGRWGVSGQNVYADIFLKLPYTYPRVKIWQYDYNMLYTLINSNEANDTTSSDRKGSTECWASIEAAATAIHGQAYTAISYGSMTTAVSYADSAGSTTSLTASGKTTLTNAIDNLNTADTWIPVIKSGAMEHTLRHLKGNIGDLEYSSSNHPYLATISTIAYWNGAYSGTASNLQYAAKGKIPRMRSSAQMTYKRKSYSSAAWGKVYMTAESNYIVGSDFVVSGNSIKVNNSNVNRVRVTGSLSGISATVGCDLYAGINCNGTTVDIIYGSYNRSTQYWMPGSSVTRIFGVSNGNTISMYGGCGNAGSFEPLNPSIVVEDVSVW